MRSRPSPSATASIANRNWAIGTLIVIQSNLSLVMTVQNENDGATEQRPQHAQRSSRTPIVPSSPLLIPRLLLGEEDGAEMVALPDEGVVRGHPHTRGGAEVRSTTSSPLPPPSFMLSESVSDSPGISAAADGPSVSSRPSSGSPSLWNMSNTAGSRYFAPHMIYYTAAAPLASGPLESGVTSPGGLGRGSPVPYLFPVSAHQSAAFCGDGVLREELCATDGKAEGASESGRSSLEEEELHAKKLARRYTHEGGQHSVPAQLGMLAPVTEEHKCLETEPQKEVNCSDHDGGDGSGVEQPHHPQQQPHNLSELLLQQQQSSNHVHPTAYFHYPQHYEHPPVAPGTDGLTEESLRVRSNANDEEDEDLMVMMDDDDDDCFGGPSPCFMRMEGLVSPRLPHHHSGSLSNTPHFYYHPTSHAPYCGQHPHRHQRRLAAQPRADALPEELLSASDSIAVPYTSRGHVSMARNQQDGSCTTLRLASICQYPPSVSTARDPSSPVLRRNTNGGDAALTGKVCSTLSGGGAGAHQHPSVGLFSSTPAWCGGGASATFPFCASSKVERDRFERNSLLIADDEEDNWRLFGGMELLGTPVGSGGQQQTVSTVRRKVKVRPPLAVGSSAGGMGSGTLTVPTTGKAERRISCDISGVTRDLPSCGGGSAMVNSTANWMVGPTANVDA